MEIDLKHKLFMGFGGFRIPIPLVLSNIGFKQGAKGTTENAGLLSKEERRVHHFIVKKMAVVKDLLQQSGLLTSWRCQMIRWMKLLTNWKV